MLARMRLSAKLSPMHHQVPSIRCLKHFARPWRPREPPVNAVAPGVVDTICPSSARSDPVALSVGHAITETYRLSLNESAPQSSFLASSRRAGLTGDTLRGTAARTLSTILHLYITCYILLCTLAISRVCAKNDRDVVKELGYLTLVTRLKRLGERFLQNSSQDCWSTRTSAFLHRISGPRALIDFGAHERG